MSESNSSLHSNHHESGDHHPHLAHHFKSMDQQTSSGKLGMWIFMSQEILFFSGLFCAFAYMKMIYPDMVKVAQTSMSWQIGGVNTVILLVSSLTMSLCVHSTRSNNNKLALKYLYATMLCGLMFLSIKAFEWFMHMHEGYYPGKYYAPIAEAPVQDPLAHIYFGLYYSLTGTHGLHVIVGLGLMVWMAMRLKKNEFDSEHYVALENTSLFWHLVDVVWVFLYPALYLMK